MGRRDIPAILETLVQPLLLQDQLATLDQLVQPDIQGTPVLGTSLAIPVTPETLGPPAILVIRVIVAILVIQVPQVRLLLKLTLVKTPD